MYLGIDMYGMEAEPPLDSGLRVGAIEPQKRVDAMRCDAMRDGRGKAREGGSVLRVTRGTGWRFGILAALGAALMVGCSSDAGESLPTQQPPDSVEETTATSSSAVTASSLTSGDGATSAAFSVLLPPFKQNWTIFGDQSVPARVTNLDRVAANVEVSLVSHGFGLTRQTSLGVINVGPGQTRPVNFSFFSIPSLSPKVPFKFEVIARVVSGPRTNQQFSSRSLSFQVSNLDLTTGGCSKPSCFQYTILGEQPIVPPPVLSRRPRLLSDAFIELTGLVNNLQYANTKFPGNRGTDLLMSPLVQFPHDALDVVAKLPKNFIPLVPLPPPPVYFFPVCLTLNAFFKDSEYPLHAPAAFMHFSIGEYLNSPVAPFTWKFAQVVGSTYLDADGCTPPMGLQKGRTYSIMADTVFSGEGREVTVQQNTTTSPNVFFSTFQLSPATPLIVQVVDWDVSDHDGRVAAVVGTILKGAHDGELDVPGENYQIYSNINAASYCGGSSGCATPSGPLVTYLGPIDPTNAATDYNSNWKFVIAHEFGHMANRARSGIYVNNYAPDDRGAPAPDTCACTHVRPESEQSHCLQSRETTGAAVVEGFAHFFAATAFNGVSKSCTFGYYKQIMDPANPNPLAPFPPPNYVSCNKPVRWMRTWCDLIPTSRDLRGVEWDWLNFFRANQTGDSPTSMTDQLRIFTQSCGGGDCSSVNPTYGVIENAAFAYYGNKNDPRGLAFRRRADENGVK